MKDHETPVAQDDRSIVTGNTREPIPGMEVCDFCGTTGIAWSFPARRVIVRQLDFTSTDPWAACETCHDLIVANDRQGLLERAAQGFARNAPAEGWNVTPVELAMLESQFRLIQGAFFAARNGEPSRL